LRRGEDESRSGGDAETDGHGAGVGVQFPFDGGLEIPSRVEGAGKGLHVAAHALAQQARGIRRLVLQVDAV
jgi:hypothetical protein